MRNPLVIGNWKLNGNQTMIKEIVASLCEKLANTYSRCTVVIAPPEIYLYLVKCATSFTPIMLGAQNVGINLSGAFTGETSAKMLKDIGVKYVIIGHSDRRIYHKESDELIRKKFIILKEQDLVPVLCIGETKIENELGQTEEVCKRQINSILNTCGSKAFKNAVIAYEPIWAIGTGQSANPEKVQAVHKFIRNHIAHIDNSIAEQIIIQYGGSVNDQNAKELFSQPDIDGALVGNASLNGRIFLKIIKAAAETFK